MVLESFNSWPQQQEVEGWSEGNWASCCDLEDVFKFHLKTSSRLRLRSFTDKKKKKAGSKLKTSGFFLAVSHRVDCICLNVCVSVLLEIFSTSSLQTLSGLALTIPYKQQKKEEKNVSIARLSFFSLLYAWWASPQGGLPGIKRQNWNDFFLFLGCQQQHSPFKHLSRLYDFSSPSSIVSAAHTWDHPRKGQHRCDAFHIIARRIKHGMRCLTQLIDIAVKVSQ